MKRADTTHTGMSDMETTQPKTNWQLLEVKQLAEIAHRYRQKARYSLNTLRLIENRRRQEVDEVERVYAGYEAMFARDSLRAALRLYKISNHDFHHAYYEYMASLEQNAFSWMSLSHSNENKQQDNALRQASA